MILGVALHTADFDLVAIDMPGHGYKQVACGKKPVSYDDWVHITKDLINFELQRDPRPIVLYSLQRGLDADVPRGSAEQESRRVRGHDLSRSAI